MGIASALGLYILVSIFSSGSESAARWKILLLSLGSAILQAFVFSLMPDKVGLLLSVVVSLGLIAGGLLFWCGVERKATVKIVVAYLGLWFALILFSEFVHERMNPGLDRP